MAATLLQAVRDVYAGLSGVPTIGEGAWVGFIPEASFRTPPNVCVIHQGTPPTYTSKGLAYETGRFRFEVYGVGLDATETLATAIMDGLGINSLSITGKVVLLFRTNYLVGYTRFGPEGQFVFKAMIDYEAKIDNP
jgi:hypothetical protein